MYYIDMNPILLIVAIVPAVFLMIQVYKADKLEKEPIGLLIRLAIMGIVSTIIAVILETIGQYILSPLDSTSLIYNILLYFIVVGLSEEWAKYILLKWRTWNSSEFNCQFDGVVYAVFVSLGFALWENIQYVYMYGLETGLVRAVTAIPGHCSFAVFMGVWYGIAKRHELVGEFDKSKRARRLAVIVPTILHGIYDFTATYAGLSYIFIIFIAIMFFYASSLVRKMSKEDKYIGYPNMDEFGNFNNFNNFNNYGN